VNDLIIPFKKKGQLIGFAASNEKDFVIKPDRLSAWILPLETLKKNLRLMVKNKQARMVTAGDTEAVVVPKEHSYRIFL